MQQAFGVVGAMCFRGDAGIDGGCGDKRRSLCRRYAQSLATKYGVNWRQALHIEPAF